MCYIEILPIMPALCSAISYHYTQKCFVIDKHSYAKLYLLFFVLTSEFIKATEMLNFTIIDTRNIGVV